MKKLLVMLLAMPVLGFAQAPDAEDVSIHGLIANGNGCPKGSKTRIVTNSRPGSKTADFFMLTFDKFIVENGPGIPRWESRKNCNIVFNVDFPKGYRFYFDSLEFDGYAEIQEGVRAHFDSKIRPPLSDRAIRFGGYIPGYFEGDYRDVIKGPLKRFDSGCEGSAMIKIENMIRMRGRNERKSYVTVDTASGLLTQAFKVKWRRC